MPVEINEVRFDEGQDAPMITPISGLSPTPVLAEVESVDFQAHGVVVVRREPNPSSGYVRHVTFVPYSNIQSIHQSYVEGS